MQKGLIPAMREVNPGAHHRYCAMHIWQNFRKHWGDTELKMAMWRCAKATTSQEFNAVMDRIRRVNPHAWDYLNRIPPSQWSRSGFSEYPKSDNYTNNNCESFNSRIKKMRGKPIITMLEEVRVYMMSIIARNKKALVGYNGVITPVQQSRLEKEKRESNKWRPFPTGDDPGNVYEVQCLPHKVMVDIGKRICSCRFWQLTGLPCRHACAALAYQNRRPEEHAHNWLSMGAYNSTYQFVIQPVPSQEYWEHVDLPPVLPPVYKKQIGRPKLKRDKKNDAPKEPTADPHRAPRKYGPITCKYCLKTGHNSRSCSKKKEAMAASAGEQSASQHPPAADDDVEAARQEEMFWEETLEAVEAAEAAATQPPPETTPVRQPIPNPAMSPSVRPPTTIRQPKKKKNVRRPPPTNQQPRPPKPTLNPTTPTTTSQPPPASDVPPTVTPQTMQAASQGTTSRFMEFMPTPTVRVSNSRRWPQPVFRPPAKKGSTTAHLKEGSSGSSNSTPIL